LLGARHDPEGRSGLSRFTRIPWDPCADSPHQRCHFVIP
jgi:hypothetical protein